MYQKFFSLKQQPFSIAPDPDFLFFTEQHKEALAHLTYGLQGNGGFVVLTGEVGTGKTTVCQFLLRDMPADTDIALIINPAVSEITLLVDICDQFSINYNRENISLKVMFDALTSWMLANHQHGRHAIVLIDEAQHLTFNVLEQLRLLTNIESDNQKPLQIILVGQTELQKKLLTKELRQLSQRITARYHLRPLDKQETNFYIHHRLTRAGAQGPIFASQAVPAIFKASGGIPLLINQICDRCLLTAYTQSLLIISASIAKKTIVEAELPKKESGLKSYTLYAISITSVFLIIFIINTQTDRISNYFKNPQKEAIQLEWLATINSAQHQEKTKKNTIPLTQEKQRIIDSTLTPFSTLLAIPSHNYTLQLATLADKKSVRKFFIKNSSLRGKTYLYQQKSTTFQYVILLGSFNTYKMAKLASKELHKRYPDIAPWIVDYKTIHSALN